MHPLREIMRTKRAGAWNVFGLRSSISTLFILWYISHGARKQLVVIFACRAAQCITGGQPTTKPRVHYLAVSQSLIVSKDDEGPLGAGRIPHLAEHLKQSAIVSISGGGAFGSCARSSSHFFAVSIAAVVVVVVIVVAVAAAGVRVSTHLIDR